MMNRESDRERCVVLASYLVENRATVRATAQRFGISKSTVHKDVTEILRHVDRALYDEVSRVLATNKQERHLRGGEATRRKYRQLQAADRMPAHAPPSSSSFSRTRSISASISSFFEASRSSAAGWYTAVMQYFPR